MQHIFAITDEHLEKVNKIARNKFDGEFVILSYGGTFCDIAQWSDKYQNVKIITVPTSRLDMSKAVQ